MTTASAVPATARDAVTGMAAARAAVGFTAAAGGGASFRTTMTWATPKAESCSSIVLPMIADSWWLRGGWLTGEPFIELHRNSGQLLDKNPAELAKKLVEL